MTLASVVNHHTSLPFLKDPHNLIAFGKSILGDNMAHTDQKTAICPLHKIILVLGGRTKYIYHGIFQNVPNGFTVYDGIFFFHA